jgi:hypothetical protein
MMSGLNDVGCVFKYSEFMFYYYLNISSLILDSQNTNIEDRGMCLEVRDRNFGHRTFQPGSALYQPAAWKTWNIPGCDFRFLCAGGSLVVNRRLIPSE